MAKPLNPNLIRANLQKSLRDLPPLPAVVLRVLQEAESANSSAHSLQELIQSDPALAGKVLRVVNSPYYGLSGQVTSLLQACVILGVQQIRNLVMSMGVMSVMQPKSDAETNSTVRAWMHSLGASFAAKTMAESKGVDAASRETLFIASLLHDIGHLYLQINFAAEVQEVEKRFATGTVSLIEAETSVLGLTHAEIGATMAEKWKLPGNLVDLIKGHEGPFTDSTSPLEFLVYLGDELTRYLYHSDEPQLSTSFDPAAIAWLNPADGYLEGILGSVDEMVKLTSSTLNAAA